MTPGLTVAGTTNARRVSREFGFDPQLGDTIIENWVGLEESILSVAAAYRVLGARTRTGQQEGSPEWRLQATFANPELVDGQTESAPDIKWEVRTEMVQLSIFSAFAIQEEADRYIDPAQYKNPAQYKKDIEDAVKAGTANPINKVKFPYSAVVYRELARGVEAFETKRFVLQGRYFASVNWYLTQRRVIEAGDYVYSAASLGTQYGVPAGLIRFLPAVPTFPGATPVGTKWGWRSRGEVSTFTYGATKVETSFDFVFAAWSTSFYFHSPYNV